MSRTLLSILSIMLLFAAFAAAQEKTKSSETATKSASFRATKAQIEKAQTMLKDKKIYSGAADGKYNDEFRAGIKSFQKENGLKETGSLSKATLEKMGIELTDSQKGASMSEDSKSDAKSGGPSAKSADGPKRPAPFRANAEQIKAVQKMLKDGKMYDGEQTGKLDDATRDGIKKYQDANGVKVTGTLNAATLQKMGVALTDKQKEQVAAQAAYDTAKKN
jgi:peptidoglycan hydrolase-like protein with peptidoglycan-binding domain